MSLSWYVWTSKALALEPPEVQINWGSGVFNPFEKGVITIITQNSSHPYLPQFLDTSSSKIPVSSRSSVLFSFSKPQNLGAVSDSAWTEAQFLTWQC